MQLSPPISVPTYPDPAPATPDAGDGNTAVPSSGQNAPASTDETFEQFLAKNKAVKTNSAPEADAPDVAKMSAILGAALWTPVVPLPPATISAAPAEVPVQNAGAIGQAPAAQSLIAACSQGAFPVQSAGVVGLGASGQNRPVSNSKGVFPVRSVETTSQPTAGPGETVPRAVVIASATNSRDPVAARNEGVLLDAGKTPQVSGEGSSAAGASTAGFSPPVAANLTGKISGENISAKETPVTSPAGMTESVPLPPVPVGSDFAAMGANAAATPSIQRPAGVSAPTPLDVSAGVATVTQNQTISTPGATKRSGPAAGRPVEKYVSADQVGSDSTVAENVAVSATDAKDSAVPMPAAQLPSTGTAAVWEKTAVAHLYASDSSKNANLPEQKSFLKAGSETVTASASGVGTGVARVTASMPPAASNRPKTSPVAEAGLMGTAAGAKLPTLEFKADAPAPVATLRETMSAVVSAVDALERQINAGHGAVDLQFHVGDQQLALRVELRDGTVHTTFRTDSSELRSALSQEWQSMVQPASGREVRLADPVFSSGPATGGDAASGSLGQGTPQRHTQNPPEPTSFNLPRNLAAPAVPEPAATAAVSSNSNQLLSAFA